MTSEATALRRGIITPEAVVLEFETAGVASRTLARLLDGLVLFGVILAFASAMGSLVGPVGSQALAIILLVLLFAFVLFGYWMMLETWWGGRTIGKAAVGIRVITVEGAPIAFRHAAIRATVGVVDFFLPPLGPVAVVTALASPRNQRLGDLAAGTIVLRDRSGTAVHHTQAMQLQMPPGGEQLVASLQVARLTDDQYGVVRRFLLRVEELSPQARRQLASELRARVEAATGVPSPPKLHDEWYLHAAGLAYQRRTGWVVGQGLVGVPMAPDSQPPPPVGPRVA